MGQYIVKIGGKYCEWSTIMDAPVTYLMPKKEFEKYYKEEYGDSGMEKLQQRMERVKKTGCSALFSFDRLENLIDTNRAGEKEKKLTKQEIIKKFTYRHYWVKIPRS